MDGEKVAEKLQEEGDGLLFPPYGTGNLLLSPKHGTVKSSVVELVEYMLSLSPGARSLSITSLLDKSEIILKVPIILKSKSLHSLVSCFFLGAVGWGFVYIKYDACNGGFLFFFLFG